MKTIEELLSFKKEINEKVDKIWEKLGANDKLEPIYDGVVNEETYSKAKYKILWILKEAYEEIDENGNVIGGGWCHAEELNKDPYKFSKIKTWQQVIYVSHGILNGFPKFNDMDYYNEQYMYEVLTNIAFINVKKIPGKTTTPSQLLISNYPIYKDILLEQIKGYEPDIVIGGNTLRFFNTDGKSDLELESLSKKGENDIRSNHYFDSKRIYIDAYHPANRGTGMTKEEYCDDIISIVKNWTEKYKKN